MFPPLWGYLFWGVLHAIGMAFAVHFKDTPIPPELSEQLMQFFIRLCKYLPCPGCRFHCTSHMTTFPPKFTTGEEVWKFTVDFHNAVNRRTNKLEVTYDEAKSLLAKDLSEFNWTVEKIEDAFMQDWWTAILMTTFSASTTPDSPSEDEKHEYMQLIKAMCYIMPFAFKKVGAGGTVRDQLVAFCSSSRFKLNNRDETFESIVNLHNAVCDQFGRVPKTVKDMKELFAQKFEQKNTTELIRANQIHEEDQKKMLELQKELNTLKGVGGTARSAAGGSSYSTSASGSSDCVSADYQTATIALSVLLGVLLLLMFAAFVAYRFKIGGEWKLVRTPHGDYVEEFEPDVPAVEHRHHRN